MTAVPVVSVVMPVRNGERFIVEALASIHAQRHAPIEIVVVDDGSTDRSAELAARDPAVTLLRLQHCSGVAAARNRGLAAATGRLIAFLDCDDLWAPGKLQRQLARLASMPAVDAVFGTIALIGRDPPRHLHAPDGDKPFISLQVGTMLARRSVFDTVGMFDERFTVAEDLDWTLRLREGGVPFAVLDDVALLYRRHDANITSDAGRMNHHTLDALRESLERRRSRNLAGDLRPWSSFVEQAAARRDRDGEPQ